VKTDRKLLDFSKQPSSLPLNKRGSLVSTSIIMRKYKTLGTYVYHADVCMIFLGGMGEFYEESASVVSIVMMKD
jgi:hypothetical protein